MTPELARVIAGLLRYSLDEVSWDFPHLTARERDIVGNPETLSRVLDWANEQRQG